MKYVVFDSLDYVIGRTKTLKRAEILYKRKNANTIYTIRPVEYARNTYTIVKCIKKKGKSEK